MLFNSFPFIFLFFPITLIFYFLFGKNKTALFQLIWIVLASLFFYSVWKKSFLYILLISVCVNFIIGQFIILKKNKLMLAFGLIFNVAVLFYFKYRGFFIDNFSSLMGITISIKHIVLPLGISFITFQKITYLVDVYYGKIKDKSFLNFLVFISFFPQLIAGPIVHYNQLMSQFSATKTKRFSYYQFNLGMTLFIMGLAKKVILADTASLYSDPMYAAISTGQSLTFEETWIGVLAYAFQIYFDFSGYSDMAIGLARIFGIRLPLNFNSPYKATSIIDFWRRWHMTLSHFLRNYIYIPLGGNRKGIIRKHANLMVTMLIGGFWHGANWTFIIWGGLHGFYLIINHMWIACCNKLGWSNLSKSFIYKLASVIVTFFFFNLALVIFRSANLSAANIAFHSLFGLNGFGITTTSYLHHMPLIKLIKWLCNIQSSTIITTEATILYLITMLTIIWLPPNSQELLRSVRKSGELLKWLAWKPSFAHFAFTTGLFFVSLGFMCDFDIKPFEYFAF